MSSRCTPLSNALAGPIAMLASAEGANRTRHPGVTVYRATVSQPPLPTLYEASVVIVGQGAKRSYLGDEAFNYDAGHYLVLTSPMPMLCEIDVHPDRPVLTAVVEIDLTLLNELLLDLSTSPRPGPSPVSRGVYATPLTPEVEDAAARLLKCLASEEATRVLARQTIREVLYHVLRGPRGVGLWTLSPATRPAGQLIRVIRYMNENFAKPLRVQQLAEMAHMSVATFHHHFRAVTSTTPLQYLKAVRLTKARTLMTQTGMSAASAAHAVGYESPSQFSREFRRFFGTPPHRESARDKTASMTVSFPGTPVLPHS
jgi:AraC-like DNA-binding protein